MNNTGTKEVSIMKQTAFWRERKGEYRECLKYSVPIFVEKIYKMQCLEVSGEERPIYGSLGVKRLTEISLQVLMLSVFRMSVFDILHHVILQFCCEVCRRKCGLYFIHNLGQNPSEPNSATLMVGSLRTSETRGGGIFIFTLCKKT